MKLCQRGNCLTAGSEYFKYQLDFVKKHYILYDCAFVGIRDACTKNGYKCDFHTCFGNPDLLTDGWSDISIEASPPTCTKLCCT